MTGPGYGPFWRIDGPLPQPPRFTLIEAARLVNPDVDAEGVERWINGVKVHSYSPDTASAWDACHHGSDVKAAGGVIPLPEFGAMTVYLGVTCSAAGIAGPGMTPQQIQDRYVARAKAVFGAVEAAAVEREFMAGDVLSLNPHLADGNGTFPWGDNPTSVLNAFVEAENAIADTGRRGMIHCSPGLATVAANGRLLERDDRTNTLRTINDTIVVPGYGYALGDTPSPHPAAGRKQEWMWATGPVEVRRGEPFVTPEVFSQALDRSDNTVTFYVERYYVVDWDTVLQVNILADRCSSECGSAPA